jgi:xylulokinase
MASSVPAGSAGITALPFGNGTERMFGNREVGSGFFGVNFNIHTSAHLVRAAHEGIAFSFNYGMNMMKETGMDTQIVRASHTNMFLSPVFRQTLADLSGSTIELYDTDGSQGAARGAGIGLGIYPSVNDAFSNLKKVKAIEPSGKETEQVTEAYQLWLRILNTIISVNQ